MRIKRDALDILFSKFIRLRAIEAVHGCERCLAWKADYKGLECSHFHGRAQKSTRWDEDNSAGLCFGCHQYFTSHPLDHVEWFRKRLGDQFDLLQVRARTPAKYIDKEAIRIYFRVKLQELGDE